MLIQQAPPIPSHALAALAAVHHARRGNIGQHKVWMVLLYVLALLVTGLFTLWPGRIMNQVLLGA